MKNLDYSKNKQFHWHEKIERIYLINNDRVKILVLLLSKREEIKVEFLYNA